MIRRLKKGQAKSNKQAWETKQEEAIDNGGVYVLKVPISHDGNVLVRAKPNRQRQSAAAKRSSARVRVT